MSRRAFLQSQILETERLLQLTGDHPLMSPGLRARKAALEAELQNLPAEMPQARATLYFNGPPVFGSIGIDAQFAASVLDPFVRMVKSQYAATRHSVAGALRVHRDEFESKLLLTALPRGSFGLELSPAQQDSPETTRVISQILLRVSGLVESSAENDDRFAESIDDAPPRTIVALRDLLKVMTDQHADFRLVTGEREVRLGGEVMQQAFERVSATISSDREVRLNGVSRGLTLDSWRFDFRPDEGNVISGRIAEEVDDANAAVMATFTNQRCAADIRVISVTSRGGRETTRFELLNLTPIQE